MSPFSLAINATETLVFNAVLKRDVAKFREALSSGFYAGHVFWFQSPEFHYYNLLQHAVKSDFHEGIEILLRETIICTRLGFIEACVKRNDEAIRLFLQVACERRSNCSEYLASLLFHKVVHLAREFIQMEGFNVDDQAHYFSGKCLRCDSGRWGQSPMHVLALFQQPQLLEQLIESGGKLDLVDTGDYTPLYVACVQGNYECCLCLLRHGASPTLSDTTRLYEDPSPRSPLSALCQLSVSPANEEIVELLLSAGLDMDKERWILGRHGRRNIADDTLRLLTSLCGVPSALTVICVRVIRQHLSKRTIGRSILKSVQGLPLPPLLKARLILSDFCKGR